MVRQIWQRAMIALARSPRAKSFMQNHAAASGLAHRYVGGAGSGTAVETALELDRAGISCSLFYLGEYVSDWDLVAENMAAKEAVITQLAKTGLDIHVSVDPTQVGCNLDWRRGAENLTRLAGLLSSCAAGRPGRHCLLLDMEDYSVNRSTIGLHDDLRSKGLHAALTLQAYLHKTEADLKAQIRAGGMVRLVKGAFAEGPERALTSRAAIHGNYIRLIDLMLGAEARETGFYPVFATHDTGLQRHAINLARERGWPKGSYEFEMLYGARDDVARALASEGERIRLYLPFGRDWWPYAIRRIGENPRNALLLARSLGGR